MERFWTYSRVLATGAPAPAATVTVYEAGTLNLATLFADNLAIPTPRANPFTADADGYTFFYAANGRYDVKFSGVAAGIPIPYTLGDIYLLDAGTGVGGGVIDASLGGSRVNSPVVTGTPATVDAVEYLEVLIPWTTLPIPGTVVTLRVSAQAPTGGSMVAELYDTISAMVVLTDPTPFTDDTQLIEHDLVLTPPAPLADQRVRLRAVVTDGDSLPCLLLGALEFTPA